MRISDWSSDVCSSDLHTRGVVVRLTAVQVEKAVSSTRASRSESASNGICASRYSAMRSAGAGWEERGQKPFPTRFHASCETSRCAGVRSEEHTSELQSLMRISYAVFCLQTKKQLTTHHPHNCNQN